MLSSSVSLISYISILILFCCRCFQTVDGHSYGSGSCLSFPAVGGFHFVSLGGLRNITSKSLSTDFPNIKVTVGDVVIDTSGVGLPMVVFQANKTYEYKITSTSRNMRGIMMRVEAPPGTSATIINGMIVHNRNTHISRVCNTNQLARGITHWNSFKKNIYTGFIKFVEPTNDVVFDITMVTVNNLFRSEYASGSFTATFAA